MPDTFRACVLGVFAVFTLSLLTMFEKRFMSWQRVFGRGGWLKLAIGVGGWQPFFAGCERPQPSTRAQSQQALLRRADRSEALLDAAVNQLRDLPSYVTTELRLPEVILDSTKSSDGQDVMATCTVNPTVQEGLINYFSVRSGNGRFRTLGVKSGDIVKYHAGLNPESLEVGFEELEVIELNVSAGARRQGLARSRGVSIKRCRCRRRSKSGGSMTTGWWRFAGR